MRGGIQLDMELTCWLLQKFNTIDLLHLVQSTMAAVYTMVITTENNHPPLHVFMLVAYIPCRLCPNVLRSSFRVFLLY